MFVVTPPAVICVMTVPWANINGTWNINIPSLEFKFISRIGKVIQKLFALSIQSFLQQIFLMKERELMCDH